MPTSTFHALPAERRDRLVREAIMEFSEHSYAEASLSRIAQRSRIAKGSFYQYFADKLDLYRWLVSEEAAERKRAFIGKPSADEDFWTGFATWIERGMAFLVEQPRLARLIAAAADPSASVDVRGLHRAICEAGNDELRAWLEQGIARRAIRSPNLDIEVATQLVGAIVGPGLTAVVLQELGATLHEVLASDKLRKRLGPARRQRLANQAVLLIQSGLGATVTPSKTSSHSNKAKKGQR
jgi:AcrR family transcriptional regulator